MYSYCINYGAWQFLHEYAGGLILASVILTLGLWLIWRWTHVYKVTSGWYRKPLEDQPPEPIKDQPESAS